MDTERAAKGEIVIASSFPVSGVDRPSGRPAEAGVAYALKKTSRLKGFTITQKRYDDAVNGVHDPQQGARNYRDMCDHKNILAAVGPLNSVVARAVIPVAAACGLATISPANTDECLTRELAACDPKASALRGKNANTYFRIAVPDTMQGRAMADFAYDALRITKVAIWSDGETSGKTVADAFGKEFESKGGSVVLRQDFDWKNTSDFRPFLRRARDAGVEGIYAGAVSGTKGCIARGQSAGILDAASVAYLGPDGIADTQCVTDAGDQARNMYAAGSGEASQNPANKATIDDFMKTMGGKEDYGRYTFPAYDATRILLDAISRAIDAAGGSMPSRKQVLDAVWGTKSLQLTTGTYSFDRYGDPTSTTIAVYQLRNDAWTFEKLLTVGR